MSDIATPAETRAVAQRTRELMQSIPDVSEAVVDYLPLRHRAKMRAVFRGLVQTLEHNVRLMESIAARQEEVDL